MRFFIFAGIAGYAVGALAHVECGPVEMHDELARLKPILSVDYKNKYRLIQYRCTESKTKRVKMGWLFDLRSPSISKMVYGTYDATSYEPIDITEYDRPVSHVYVSLRRPVAFANIPTVFDVVDLVPQEVYLGERDNSDGSRATIDYTIDTNLAFHDFLRSEPYAFEDPWDFIEPFRNAAYWPETFTYHWVRSTGSQLLGSLLIGERNDFSEAYLRYRHLYVLEKFTAQTVFFEDHAIFRKVEVLGELPDEWTRLPIQSDHCEPTKLMNTRKMGELIFPGRVSTEHRTIYWEKPGNRDAARTLFVLERENGYELGTFDTYWGPRFTSADGTSFSIKVRVDKKNLGRFSVEFL